VYDGVLETRPPLGQGPAAQAADILRAWRLVWRTTLLWVAVVLCAAGLLAFFGAQHA
jgi:adenosylcobinamide-phosphate synthase